MSGNNIIYTIGHSNHSVEEFIELLNRHKITAVADIRSVPYSRYSPQFNKKALEVLLKREGIVYVFMGRELGGRPDDPGCYEDGGINYDLVVEMPFFKEGLERLVKGCKKYRLVLLCAEKDPLKCHRTLLVGRQLQAMGCGEVRNILADGTLL